MLTDPSKLQSLILINTKAAFLDALCTVWVLHIYEYMNIRSVIETAITSGKANLKQCQQWSS